eukprot:scaffold12664_cov63-Phaeocystis_antarctica.AAC.1
MSKVDCSCSTPSPAPAPASGVEAAIIMFASAPLLVLPATCKTLRAAEPSWDLDDERRLRYRRVQEAKQHLPGEIRGRRRPTEVATMSRAEALRESAAGRFALLPKPATYTPHHKDLGPSGGCKGPKNVV